MLNEVLIARSTTLHAYTTTVLDTILCKRCTLDVAHVRDGDNHIVVGIEILGVELLRRVNNLRAALIAILCLDLHQLILDDLHQHIHACQYNQEVVDLTLQLSMLVLQLLALQACELTQTHLHDSR